MCCTLNNTCRTLSTIHKQYTKRNNAKGKVVVHSTTRHRLIATQNASAASPSAHLSSKARAVQSKPPRRIKRLREKAQQRAVEPVSRPRPRRAEVPSLFGPPRSSRRRQEGTASIATDEDVKNFIECYGSTMNITTAWQWNSDRESSLQQAASSYAPPIRTILSTLKVALEHRAHRSAEEES